MPIILFLLFVGCAIPFEIAETLDRGQAELMAGYSSFLNLTVKGNFGITGSTDLGFGVDIPPVNAYLTPKQKLLSLGENPRFNLLISGAYGLLSYTDIPYYHCTLLTGIDNIGRECITLGGGILQDPRYTFNFLGSPTYSRKKFYHTIIGVSNEKFIMQFQFIYDPQEYNRDKIRVSLGFGIRSIQFLE